MKRDMDLVRALMLFLDERDSPSAVKADDIRLEATAVATSSIT